MEQIVEFKDLQRYPLAEAIRLLLLALQNKDSTSIDIIETDAGLKYKVNAPDGTNFLVDNTRVIGLVKVDDSRLPKYDSDISAFLMGT